MPVWILLSVKLVELVNILSLEGVDVFETLEENEPHTVSDSRCFSAYVVVSSSFLLIIQKDLELPKSVTYLFSVEAFWLLSVSSQTVAWFVMLLSVLQARDY